MAILNLLLPWRWKRRFSAILDEKLQSTSDTLTARLNDTGDTLVGALNNARDRLVQEIAQYSSSSSETSARFDNSIASLLAAFNDTRHSLNSAFDDIRASLIGELNDVRVQLENRISQQSEEICELREEMYNLQSASRDRQDDASSLRLKSAAGDVRRGLSALKNEIAAQLGFGMYDMATQVSDQQQWLERIEAYVASRPAQLDDIRNRVAEHRIWLEKISSETTNLISNLDASLHSRLNTLENVELPGIADQIHEVAAAQLHFTAQRADRSRWRADPKERYKPACAQPFDSYLAQARRDFPGIFDMWRERLDATLVAFEQTKVGNVAHASDLYSRIFRDFVETHAIGRVLDVGCGVFGRPYYLGGYPAELISALEPLPMREPADFELVRGLGEYLPWPDGSFSTVVSATSLDHCLSLERSLAEMARVLSPDGRILLWIGSVPGAPKFEPDRPDFTPSDQYHLFHFDKAWFEPLLDEEFELLDRIELKRPGYSHVVYNLRPRRQQPHDPALTQRDPAAVIT
jgi:SAM-dependent methyltransferase